MSALRASLLALAAAIALPLAACRHEYQPLQPRESKHTLQIGGKEITVEVADKQASRERGLMFRTELPADHGMLFAYAEPKILSFWMRNTSIPLSIAFIEELPDQKGRIVNIEEMAPFVEYPSHSSHRPVRLALEMNAKWFERHGVKAGDVFDLPEWVENLVPGADQESG